MSIQILCVKKILSKKKSKIIFLISLFRRTKSDHQKSNCTCIRNSILNNFSEKNLKKNKGVFCESGTALKSYGQFPDNPIASESNPHVPVRGFTR